MKPEHDVGGGFVERMIRRKVNPRVLDTGILLLCERCPTFDDRIEAEFLFDKLTRHDATPCESGQIGHRKQVEFLPLESNANSAFARCFCVSSDSVFSSVSSM